MTTTLWRRVERLERNLTPGWLGPCFITDAAEREIARLRAEFGGRLPRTLFVMTLADRRIRHH